MVHLIPVGPGGDDSSQQLAVHTHSSSWHWVVICTLKNSVITIRVLARWIISLNIQYHQTCNITSEYRHKNVKNSRNLIAACNLARLVITLPT
jgi:hypothetical protein